MAGLEIRKPSLERSELVKARRSTSVTKRAVPSADLERDISGKALGDDHVRLAIAELVALDEPIETQRQRGGAAQDRGGLTRSHQCP